MKKLLAALLTLFLLLVWLPAFTLGEGEPPTKLKLMRVAVEQDPSTDRLLIELQKRTNTELEFITAPWDSYGTRVTTVLASGEQVDVIVVDTNGAFNYPQICRDGLLLELDDYLATDAYPILKRTAYGDIYWWRYNVDGKVYGIPQPIQPGDWNNYIRTDWLERVNLDVPTTPDEMYEVLKAFKYGDPDGNGVDDTIGFHGATFNGQLGPIYAMFANFYGTSFEEKDGKIIYVNASESMKDGLTFVNKLYHEGLINQDLVTINDRNYSRNKFAAGLSGWVCSSLIPNELGEIRKISPEANVTLMSPLPHSENSIGAYAADSHWNWMQSILPSTCSNPEKTLELLEYLCTDEGRILMCTGIEGIHYERYEQVEDAGVFYGVNLEEQAKDWDPAKADGPTCSPLGWGLGSTIIGIIPYFEYDSLEEALQNAISFATIEDYETNPYWDMRKQGSKLTNHNPVPVQIEEWIEIQNDLGSVFSEYEAMIITADEGDIDRLWDEYLERLDYVGLQDGLAAVQKWYDENKG